MATSRSYVILREKRAFQTGEPFSPVSSLRFPSFHFEAAAAATEPKLETASLTHAEVSDVARDPGVTAIAPSMPTRLIEPVATAEAAGAPGAIWGIGAVGADQSPADGQNVVVAVLDTGIDASHPAFQGVQLIQKDFTGDGDGDRNGHGTHCAGTIFGRDVDGKRIGIARGVSKVLIGKILRDRGGGDSEMIFNGINWAVDNGANVISMSVGFDFSGLVDNLVTKENWPIRPATSSALEAFRGNLRMFDRIMALMKARGAFGTACTVIAAAGNESNRPLYEIAASVPAAAEDVISVAALQQDGGALKVANFSNTLAQISAPGVDIVSAKTGGGLMSLSGTSMACPHVAGVTALWWQVVRQSPVPATPDVLKARLFATARTNLFAAGVDVAARGVGLVTAPSSAHL